MLDAAPTTAQSEEALLEVNNIEVIYNHVILVLKGVSLTVPKGGITALLGGNGAGKTTTLKAISNLLHSERGEVTKGSINYKGETVQGLDPAALVKRGVIQVMEGRHCFEHLTVDENLAFWAQVFGGGDPEAAIRAFDLAALRDRPAGGLSGGQKRRLSLARLMVTGRRLWILDEPVANLDTSGTQFLLVEMQAHLDQGGMLITTSNLNDQTLKPNSEINLDKA